MPPKSAKFHPEQGFADHCCDLLSTVGPCTAKRMFGGWGIRCDGLMIGMIASEALYLKVDAATKPQFLAEGGRPFVWEGPEKRIEMGFVTPPDDAMDARHFMLPWARMAMEAALRSANAKPLRKSAAKPPVRKGSSLFTNPVR